MAPVNAKRYLEQSVAEIKRRTDAGERVAVTFDVDNTLFDTRGRVLAIGREFDRAHGTTYFKGKTAKQMGNDGRETSARLKMTPEHAKLFHAWFFRNFFKGENFKSDAAMKPTIELAKKAAKAGADVYFVTARTQREERWTIDQLRAAGLPADDTFVVSKPRMADKTADYKAAELTRIAGSYDYVPWFITESRADIAGVQDRNVPVKSVLLDTKFSGDRKVADDTPIWKLNVK